MLPRYRQHVARTSNMLPATSNVLPGNMLPSTCWLVRRSAEAWCKRGFRKYFCIGTVPVFCMLLKQLYLAELVTNSGFMLLPIMCGVLSFNRNLRNYLAVCKSPLLSVFKSCVTHSLARDVYCPCCSNCQRRFA